MQRPSASAAACLLELWLKGQHQLTETQYDDLVDVVILLLEQCNDETYRFAPDTETERQET